MGKKAKYVATTRRVRFNRRSVVLSYFFSANMLILPLEIYLYEVSPIPDLGLRAPPAFPAAFDPYSYDREHVVDIVRTTLPRNCSHSDSPSTILHTYVGAFYFSQDLQDHLAALTCSMPSVNGVART
ncbi:Aste57867_14333 [Aphanomyces stellatus]|uniref:Aste57867_14333 protein n=1 Tax=Aphanomyces stellatus TaxID=120398 RepID=A0A485L2U2_9STRA|nr:hypothetical protein As57867_014279 [Aphanomyces stellatus]VFT91157.1 Aste57867_14333 [Aphanomyces stellatus]